MPWFEIAVGAAYVALGLVGIRVCCSRPRGPILLELGLIFFSVYSLSVGVVILLLVLAASL